MFENPVPKDESNGIYHIVFMAKPCYKEIQTRRSGDIVQLLKQVAASKGAEIIEAAAFSDHVYICLKMSGISVSRFVGYLKRMSSLQLLGLPTKNKQVYRTRYFWSPGFGMSTSGLQYGSVQRFIREHGKMVPPPVRRTAVNAQPLHWQAEC